MLQHEQIHFALTELAARRLDAETARRIGNLRMSGATFDAASKAIQTRIEAYLARALEAVYEENSRFDEDTSARHDPAKQQLWWERVQRELAAPAPL